MATSELPNKCWYSLHADTQCTLEKLDVATKPLLVEACAGAQGVEHLCHTTCNFKTTLCW